ncbi:MAG: glycosyltransferase [Deltaproteobacteria bacterium]|nr:glycosyltransferase [Deltaproteobacteria bacterium]
MARYRAGNGLELPPVPGIHSLMKEISMNLTGTASGIMQPVNQAQREPTKSKLLQLASANIADTSGGMHLRNYHLAQQLAKVMDVTHIGFGKPSKVVRRTECEERIRIALVPKQPSYTLAKLACGALGRTPVTLLNFYSATMAATLASELAAVRYDTVLIEGIEMVPYIPVIRANKHHVRHLVLDWHNIESEVVARHSVNAATPLHRLYMRRVSQQLRRIETELLANCDLHLVTSGREERELLCRQPSAGIIVVENGVDARYFTQGSQGKDDCSSRVGRYRILFVGAMDYSANIDGVSYFARQIWPRIHQAFPELIFTIVGRNPPERLRTMASGPGIEVTGTVADVRPYYRDALAAVVPLRVGGGTRLKILEAMAAGVPVVSTRIGAEGLRIEPEKHFLEAETPGDFHTQVGRLRPDFNLWQRLSSLGRKLVEAVYDWNIIGSHLAETFLELSGGQRSGSPLAYASASRERQQA